MGRLNLENLTYEEKEKLKEYVASIKEIKKEIGKMLRKGNPVQEEKQKIGGNHSTGKTLQLPPNM
jgi:hypothetical protein